MQFYDLFCYVILTITVAASCVHAEEQTNDLADTQNEKRIAKRDATILIDSYSRKPIYHRPKVIYRRISKHRYGPPAKPKHAPLRQKYRPHPPKYAAPRMTRKPGKKYRGKKPYGPLGYEKRTLKPRFGPPPPKRQKKTAYRPRNKLPNYAYYPIADLPSGFGEPPLDIEQHQSASKQKVVEHAVDSYGAPVKENLDDLVSTTNSVQETTVHYDNDEQELSSFNQEPWPSFSKEINTDTDYDTLKKLPSFIKTEPNILITPAPDFGEKNLNSYSDIYMYREKFRDRKLKKNDKMKKQQQQKYVLDNFKVLNRPWKAEKRPHQAQPEPDDDNDIIVGGQYAEPPARYAHEYQPNMRMFSYDEDIHPSRVYKDMGIMMATAHKSPYVNYKNSNMAFSPQNLNDAFSIEK